MSNTIALPLVRKLRFTPMTDLLRGRVSGRLDLRALVDASNLPTPVRATVLRVAKRTRLWRAEKVEVAKELLAHFADGLDSGEPAERLIEKFGDERAAAKLIRRAKKRGRPLVWHALRAVSWAMVALLALYLIAGLRLVAGRPAPSVNYVEQINRAIAAEPQDEHAWPMYRAAILSMRDAKGHYPSELEWPGSPEKWPGLRDWLLAHQEGLEQARAAAAKRSLGFLFGPNGSARDAELFPTLTSYKDDESTRAGVILYSVLLPHLTDLPRIAVALAADAHLAREQGDPARAEADLTAILHMGDQLHAGNGFTVVDLVALHLRSVVLDGIEAVLLDGRADAGTVQRLSHSLAGPSRAADLVSLTGERNAVHDVIQRMYTDDGNGNGHMTWRGIALASSAYEPRDERQWRMIALQSPVMTASREEITRDIDEYFNLCQAQLAQPLRDADWSQTEERVKRWKADMARFWPAAIAAPSFANAHRMAETYLGRRDGMLIALASEAYRLRTGKYPDTLAPLAPEYFSHLPVDRINGGPLHYRLVNGRPMVYSVGADGDDDGGKVTRHRFGLGGIDQSPQWHLKAQEAADGDWILYPSPREDDAVTTGSSD
jgi:hypothetical protein